MMSSKSLKPMESSKKLWQAKKRWWRALTRKVLWKI